MKSLVQTSPFIGLRILKLQVVLIVHVLTWHPLYRRHETSQRRNPYPNAKQTWDSFLMPSMQFQKFFTSSNNANTKPNDLDTNLLAWPNIFRGERRPVGAICLTVAGVVGGWTFKGGSDLNAGVVESPRPSRPSSASREMDARDECLFIIPCKNPDIILHGEYCVNVFSRRRCRDWCEFRLNWWRGSCSAKGVRELGLPSKLLDCRYQFPLLPTKGLHHRRYPRNRWRNRRERPSRWPPDP